MNEWVMVRREERAIYTQAKFNRLNLRQKFRYRSPELRAVETSGATSGSLKKAEGKIRKC